MDHQPQTICLHPAATLIFLRLTLEAFVRPGLTYGSIEHRLDKQ